MAKKKLTSLYACVAQRGCTFDIVNEKGESYQKKFYPISELESERSTQSVKAGMQQGGLDESRCMLEVPKGELVCKHFIAYDDSAEEDREDQMANPAKYIESERDVILIAELLVKDGQFRDRASAEEGIKSLEDVDADTIVEAGKDVSRELAIMEMLNRVESTDDEKADNKARRKMLMAILKENDIKGVFPGAAPEAMAGRIYDEEIYKKA